MRLKKIRNKCPEAIHPEPVPGGGFLSTAALCLFKGDCYVSLYTVVFKSVCGVVQVIEFNAFSHAEKLYLARRHAAGITLPALGSGDNVRVSRCVQGNLQTTAENTVCHMLYTDGSS